MEFYYHANTKDVVILAADGGLNRETAGEFSDQLITLIEQGLTKIVVDCAALEHISTVGLSVLIRLHKRLSEHGGNVRLCNVGGMIPGLLSITKLDQLFSIHPGVDEAVASFEG